jgi:hypothetical protein
MKDAEHQDLAGTHKTQMLLEMFLLNKSEEILGHGLRCAWTQNHIVGTYLVAIIMFFHLLLLFCGVLCSIAHGLGRLAVTIWLFRMMYIITYASGCVAWLRGVITDAPGVLCSITGACGVLCRITSSIASIY